MIRHLALLLILNLAALAATAAPYPPVVAAWPNGPLETRVALEFPVGAASAKPLVGRTITFDESKGTLHIAGARLADEGRTLILATDPHPRDATYRLELGSQIVTYSLHGVDVTWTAGDDEDAKPTWSGWWPSLDAKETSKLAKSSSEHAKLMGLLSEPGRLRIRGILTMPEGDHSLQLNTSGLVDATIGDAAGTSGDGGSLNLALGSTGEPVDLDVTITTKAGTPFALTFCSPAGEPIPSTSLLVPWTPIAPFVPASASPVPDLAGGDPVKGEQVYLGETAKCASCHKINGKGGDVGPDLTKQADRDLAAIYRDVNEPSAVIHPDYVQYIVATRNGQVVAGIVRAEGPETIKVTDANAKSTLIPRSEIEDLRPGSASLMPVGLVGAIGEERMKDLVAYLKSAGRNPTAGGKGDADEKSR